MAEDVGKDQEGKSYNEIVTSVSMGSDIVISQVKRESSPGTSSYVGNTQVIVRDGDAGMYVIIERFFPQIMLQV
jgi:hypothetical protein